MSGIEVDMDKRLSFFEKLDVVERIVKNEKDCEEAVRKLKPFLDDPAVSRVFYEFLDSVKWIDPLSRAGYFSNPPRVEKLPLGGVQYTPWPAGKYLSKIAKESPREVAIVLAGIETDNAAVISNILDAALKMPVIEMSKLVPVLCRAVGSEAVWWSFKDATKVCAVLAEGGKEEEALRLSTALLAPAFRKRGKGPDRQDRFWYEEGLKTIVPVLAKRITEQFLPKLCDWLVAAVKNSTYMTRRRPDGIDDASYLWRPAIEESSRNPSYYFEGTVAGFVRQGFEEAIKEGSLTLEEGLKILEKYPYLVFRRIEMHLICEFAGDDLTWVRKKIMDPNLFDGLGYKHEYGRLVRQYFGQLSSEDKEQWFQWVDSGPERSEDEEEDEEQEKWWKFKKLHWVAEYLEGERKHFYEGMLQEHGEPMFADWNSGPTEGMWEGDKSPMTVEELQEVSFEAAIERVNSWQPEPQREWGGNSVSGLASTFSKYVSGNRAEFSRKAECMVDKAAAYVRSYISEMAEGVKAGQEIDVPAVLALCQWVVERAIEERTTPYQEDEGHVEENWQEARDSIGRFVENVCKAKKGEGLEYGLGIRESLWSLIEKLIDSRVESGLESKSGNALTTTYVDHAINSPRGKAMEVVFAYARWVANHKKEKEEGREVVPGGFGVMPEVKGVLEEQIAPEKRTREVLSIVGLHVGLIGAIDIEWLAENAEKIFNLGGIEKTPAEEEGWAAWNAFMVYGRLYKNLYEAFKEQYAYAVQQIGKVQVDENDSMGPVLNLAKHLVILYWKGGIDLQEGGLLRELLERADSAIRRHAIRSVADILKDVEDISVEELGRFKDLWELYWCAYGKDDAKEEPEGWLFGPWFAEGKFEEEWALERLDEFIEVVGIPEPGRGVVSRLAEIAEADIERTIRILGRMVDEDKRGGKIWEWVDSSDNLEPLKSMLGKGLEHGNSREEAIRIINEVGRRGFIKIGDLLRGREEA